MNFQPIIANDFIYPLLRQVPPWLLISALAGLTSAAAFFVVAGRGFRSLPTYLVVGLAVAPLSQIVAAGLPPLAPPFTMGEVQLAFVALGTWIFLTIARLFRL